MGRSSLLRGACCMDPFALITYSNSGDAIVVPEQVLQQQQGNDAGNNNSSNNNNNHRKHFANNRNNNNSSNGGHSSSSRRFGDSNRSLNTLPSIQGPVPSLREELGVTDLDEQVLPTTITSSSEDARGRLVPYDPETQRERREAFGWTLDAAARGVAVMGGAVFVSTALLHKANEAAGCDAWEDSNEVCDGRVYGMKPSSLLTNIVTVVGLISASLMPVVGSIIDHTDRRRDVGRISAMIFTLLILVQVVCLQFYWFGAAIAQVAIAFCYSVHLCAVFAYLPELTDDQAKLTKYAARFTAAQYSASVVFLVLMVYILSLIGVYEEAASVLASQICVCLCCAIFFGYAWTGLFQDRPARQQIAPGESIYGAGLTKIYKTTRAILLHHKALKWFLIATSFTEAAATAFSSIAITYMTDQLYFSSTENGIAILLLLVFAVPGTRIAAFVTQRFNPIRSLQACLCLWMLNTAAASVVLKGPGQQMTVMVFSVVWGLSIGWVYPTEKALYCSIINKGSEAELMGVYICACQILGWLPPLIFTIMNEMEISMRIGLFSLNAYFLISFLVLFLVGDHEEAMQHAKDIDDGKILFALDDYDVEAAVLKRNSSHDRTVSSADEIGGGVDERNNNNKKSGEDEEEISITADYKQFKDIE